MTWSQPCYSCQDQNYIGSSFKIFVVGLTQFRFNNFYQQYQSRETMTLKEKLRANKTAFGTCCISTSPHFVNGTKVRYSNSLIEII